MKLRILNTGGRRSGIPGGGMIRNATDWFGFEASTRALNGFAGRPRQQ